jgi:hypothetical protein
VAAMSWPSYQAGEPTKAPRRLTYSMAEYSACGPPFYMFFGSTRTNSRQDQDLAVPYAFAMNAATSALA